LIPFFNAFCLVGDVGYGIDTEFKEKRIKQSFGKSFNFFKLFLLKKTEQLAK